jgi:hypothetical protein
MRASLILFAAMTVSCSHVQKEEMTADEHRAEAAVHLEKAREERELYDPSKTMRPAPRAAGSPMFGQVDVPFEPYNPSDAHMQAADREMIEANQHLAAARALEKFEDQACSGLSVAERSACPLFASAVKQVEWKEGGFKLTFKQASEAAQTFPRLRCHLAFAVANGFDRPSCPLFVKGTTLRRDGADGIVFEGDSPEVAIALRAQARRIFPSVAAVQPPTSSR